MEYTLKLPIFKFMGQVNRVGKEYAFAVLI